jgi:tyrosine-specific transport protein
MSKKLKTSILAISIICSSIIGVGIFSLPYVAIQVGIWTMVGYFLVLGAIVMVVHVLFGKISLATPDSSRLAKFAEIYLGRWGKLTAFILAIVGSFGAILSYLIVGSEFSKELFSPIFGGNQTIYLLIYFLIGAFFIYFGVEIVSRIGLWRLILLFSAFIFIFFYANHQGLFKVENLFLIGGQGLNNLFLPYGIVLFSLWGTTFVPEAEEMMGENKRLLRIVLPIATIIPIFVYVFFMILIVGIMGTGTTEFALDGLKNSLGGKLSTAVMFLGIITTLTSFISVGFGLKRLLYFDSKINHYLSWAITCFVPLILFFIGVKNFLPLISFLGGALLGIEGILIILMYQKLWSKENPSSKKVYYLTIPLLLIFLAGIVYEIVYSF